MILLDISFPPAVRILLVAIYMLFIVFTIVRILLDTHSTPKTLAYILVVIVLPLVGFIIYYAFGINYRHRKITNKTADIYHAVTDEYKRTVPDRTREHVKHHPELLEKHAGLVDFIHTIGGEKLSQNQYKLLTNGEEKFPEVLKSLEKAEKFIHMEYYAWENDVRGNQIKEVLLRKIREGIAVRVMFDAYASRKIKHNIVKELREGGAEIYPVIKIKLARLANRVNHRDHRKVIIIDGHTGFVGGINLSDRYDNSIDTGLWWRDTHVKIMGATVHNLQRHFIVNWNTAQPNKLPVTKDLFPDVIQAPGANEKGFSQVVAGGPSYPLSNIMLTYLKIFSSAKQKLYITNPYFIPNDSILDALKQAALSGVDVRIMMPEKSDSALVGAAARFFYAELLQTGVKLFLYKKGFVHAKTVVADSDLSVVGTANMDIRSFNLNFEIMSVIYGKGFAQKMEKTFMEDLKLCTELHYESWIRQASWKKLTWAIARLISAFL